MIGCHAGPLSGPELRVEIPRKVEKLFSPPGTLIGHLGNPRNFQPSDWAPRHSDCLITALRASPPRRAEPVSRRGAPVMVVGRGKVVCALFLIYRWNQNFGEKSTISCLLHEPPSSTAPNLV